MKILFTRGLWGGQDKGAPLRAKQFQQDYLSESVLHGLKTLLGSNVVDAPRIWSAYKSEFESGRHSYSECYGRGFTVCGGLGANDEADRSDIEIKIKSDYFDLIILSCVHMGSQYMDLILQHCPKHKLIVLDGDDFTSIHTNFIGRSVYFKRELVGANSNLHPISFAFPKERIIKSKPVKTKEVAQIIPANKSTYTFVNEKDYYADYATSRFGLTHKKAGWDCMRHYEILGNRCLPLFTNIENCPERTCTTLPKKLLVDILYKMTKYNSDGQWFAATSAGERYYEETEEKVFEHFIKNCTTDVLAKYVLETHKKAVA